MRRLAFACLLVLATGSAIAHEVRPGFLELVADGAAVKVLWKAPMRDGYVLPITPVLPATCRDLAPPSRQAIAASLVERRRLDCGPAGLAGATIAIDGLATTLTDVIVRVDLPGLRETVLLKPAAPSFTVTGERPWTRLAADYFRLGVEHILLGVDHLLFVFGLLLVVANVWLLVKTITAFTVAHSITLALATLSIVKVPAAAVEATIALSIVFLAVEIVHARRGRAGITHRLPWLVAFVFGLLHGFGFAGALAEVGLPQTDIPLALLFFNLGVEAGQLLFIGALVAFYAVARRVGAGDLRRFDGWPAYAIGSVAAFWVFDRMAGML